VEVPSGDPSKKNWIELMEAGEAAEEEAERVMVEEMVEPFEGESHEMAGVEICV